MAVPQKASEDERHSRCDSVTVAAVVKHLLDY
jgi:hypothetical protein